MTKRVVETGSDTTPQAASSAYGVALRATDMTKAEYLWLDGGGEWRTVEDWLRELKRVGFMVVRDPSYTKIPTLRKNGTIIFKSAPAATSTENAE